MKVTVHQKKNEETKMGKKMAEERKQVKLYAALLRSFRGQHSEKMKGRARGNWDPGGG